MRASHISAIGLAAVVALGALACDDPAKDKAKAGSEAVPAASTVQAAQSAAPAAPAASATAVKQSFDESGSKVEWVGSKVTGKHDGGFGKFKGTIDAVDGAPEKSQVKVEIETASLTSDAEKLTAHLKGADFFDVEKHPKATFESTEIKVGGDKGTHTVTGKLTIKGISRSITFPATIKAGAESSSLDAEFTINRREFDLNYAGMPNDLIRDDVVIKLHVQAKKS